MMANGIGGFEGELKKRAIVFMPYLFAFLEIICLATG